MLHRYFVREMQKGNCLTAPSPKTSVSQYVIVCKSSSESCFSLGLDCSFPAMSDDSFRNKPLLCALGAPVSGASSGNLNLNWGLPMVYTCLDLTGEAVCREDDVKFCVFGLGSLATHCAYGSTWCYAPCQAW